MAKQVWACDKCGTIHKDEEAAIKCEKEHIDKTKIKIVKVTHHNRRGMTCKIPSHIHIAFSDRHGDFATYVLERYGQAGL